MTAPAGQPFPLVTGELAMEVGDELLFRQVTEHNWDPAVPEPSSTAFGPKTADQGKPSFSRSTVVTAQQSRDWHTANARSMSLGVWACSTAEVDEAGTRAVDDSAVPPATDEVKAPGHAFVDYRHLDKKAERVTRQVLLARALERKEIPTST